MNWHIPPRIKVYGALGCIADERITFEESDDCCVAKVFSSSNGKCYTVTWSKAKNAIMSNDNSSYWKAELGYPSIALLMLNDILPLDKKLSNSLKGILWKDINQKHKNDWAKTEEEVYLVAHRRGVDKEKLKVGAEKVLVGIEKLGVGLLGEKTMPPEGH